MTTIEKHDHGDGNALGLWRAATHPPPPPPGMNCDQDEEFETGTHRSRSGLGSNSVHTTEGPYPPKGAGDAVSVPDKTEAFDDSVDKDVGRTTPDHASCATAAVEDEAPLKMEYEDPGLKGWLCVVGSVMVNMICYGMTQSWGVFQEYYTTHTLSTSTGMAVSWIGAIQFCLCPMLGCIAGPLFDAGYLRHLVVCGGGLYVFCLMMTSIAHSYYQVLLAHGIGVGCGMGIIFSPSVAVLNHHFSRSRYRTLAYGFQASGSAVAGIYFPIMLNYLIPAVGIGWSLRILGFIVLIYCTCAFFFLSTTVPPRQHIAVMSPVVFKNPAYAVYVSGACLCSTAIYAVQTFGVTYATSKGVPVTIANYTPAISNGVSLIGRIIPLIVAQRVGPINVLATFALSSGTMAMFWTMARTTGTILAYDAIYGIVSGAYGASLNPGAASFAPHTNQSGLYLGMCFFVTSWFWLAGTPITAALIDASPTYLPASMFCGAVLLGGGVLLFVSRFMRSKQVGTPWV